MITSLVPWPKRLFKSDQDLESVCVSNPCLLDLQISPAALGYLFDIREGVLSRVRPSTSYPQSRRMALIGDMAMLYTMVYLAMVRPFLRAVHTVASTSAAMPHTTKRNCEIGRWIGRARGRVTSLRRPTRAITSISHGQSLRRFCLAQYLSNIRPCFTCAWFV